MALVVVVYQIEETWIKRYVHVCTESSLTVHFITYMVITLVLINLYVLVSNFTSF